MRLDSLMSYKTSFQLTKVITLAVIIASSTALVLGYIYMANKIKEVSDQVLVIDSKGVAYESQVMNQAETRIYEYEDHIRTFYTLWYQFDENSYKANIEKGLHLVGENGKNLLNAYKDEDVEKKLWERNLSLSVQIEEVTIDMTTEPVTGYIKGVQTVRRGKGEISRNLNATFSIRDVSRSRENSHGAKIEKWQIVDQSTISNKE